MIIKHLVLNTSDIEGAGKFYAGLLQLPVIEVTENKISFQAGSSVLSFLKVPHKCFYHLAFNITSCSFDYNFEWIQNKTEILPFSTSSPVADYPTWNAKAFYFHDHEGNICECITRFGLPSRLKDLEYKNPKPFMSISEIGIVVDDVSDVLRRINELHEVPLFSRGPQLPEFTPMGDDEGLLLITQTNRGWWPTGRPAEKHDLEVSFLQNGKIRSLEINSGKIVLPNITFTELEDRAKGK